MKEKWKEMKNINEKRQETGKTKGPTKMSKQLYSELIDERFLQP